ncbi:carbonic anhydrase-like [Lethenteron reissneri]|uniref:carbonic anhydrase-like n=1 Tax=Lethenteron reissneri TaxID=7753 RepID=UPI002AB70007|nr:carbonic anhydrase-like [Lethenteron reissneri]
MCEHWGYGSENGPEVWGQHFKNADGSRQSPIDIVPASAVYDAALGALSVSYSGADSMSISNSGHSFSVDYNDSGDSSVLSGGPLANPYKLKQFHFHWGTSDAKGSEHTVDGKSYSAELHLVHWNAVKYASFDEAKDKSDGLAVLGAFVEVGANNAGLQKVTDALKAIENKGAKADFKNYDPSVLLPKSLDFWSYLGSLTTPPLNESAIWIVLKDPISVSKEQLAAFRSVKASDGSQLVCNFRPTQPLKGRVVQASFK